jgi:GxxExxY protein
VKSAAITHSIIGAALEVHNLLGPGFLESVYKHSLIRELELRGLQAETEVEVPIRYKTHLVATHMMDLIVEGSVIVELKAITSLTDIHVAQVLSYLKATSVEVALLFNFGEASLVWKRLIKSRGFRGFRGFVGDK